MCVCVCAPVSPHVTRQLADWESYYIYIIIIIQQLLIQSVQRRNSWPVTQSTLSCRVCVRVCAGAQRHVWHRPAKQCVITPSYTHDNTHMHNSLRGQIRSFKISSENVKKCHFFLRFSRQDDAKSHIINTTKHKVIKWAVISLEAHAKILIQVHSGGFPPMFDCS